jgi:glycosyltransferase involved in cell wall biosynthesis
MSSLHFSIIIPVKKIDQLLVEAMSHLLKLDYLSYEVIIVVDKKIRKNAWKKTRIISSGAVGPAKKRDLGSKTAKGEILAFIDSDAYPDKSWLKHALPHFKKNYVAAVGGPGVTPINSSFMEEASGWVSSSPLGAGPYTYRFLPGKQRQVDDFPAMNLLVRKKDFNEVGGFDSNYFPGEDTKLCLDLVKLGKIIIYEPKAVVFHHRRSLWWPHLKQNGNFGLHRGYFAHQLPQTSARLVYFLPSLLALGLAINLLDGFGMYWLEDLTQTGLDIYVFLLLINAVWVGYKSGSIFQGLISIPAIFATHVWYGAKFIQGFLSVKQIEKK